MNSCCLDQKGAPTDLNVLCRFKLPYELHRILSIETPVVLRLAVPLKLRVDDPNDLASAVV